MTGIYKITNLLNGKIYIGQSIDIMRRWRQHRSSYKKNNQWNTPLYNSMHKYGLINFMFEVIEECPRDLLSSREQYWIQYFNTYDRQYGYNQTLGGDGNPGCAIKLSEEDVLLIYDLLSKKQLSQNQIAEMFNIGIDTVSELNWGKTRHHNNVDYPIRVNKAVPKVRKRFPLELTEQQLLQDYQQLHSFAAIGRKYHVSAHPIRRIALKYGYTAKMLYQQYAQVKKAQRRPVQQFDLDGNFIRLFKDSREASHIMRDEHIKQVCDGKRAYSRGYKYNYL